MDAIQAKDKVGKRLFRHRRLVEDLLRGYVPGRWIGQVDFGTLRPMPTEFINRSGDRRFGDTLWLAGLRDGRRVMVIVELQSGGDPKMAVRMAVYAGMAYENLTPAAKDSNGRYPAVLPLVVYTGAQAWGAADSLRDLVDGVDGLAHYTAPRCYRRLDLCKLARDDARQTNRLDLLARLTASGSLSDMMPILRAAATWFRRDGDDEEDRSLFWAYLDWVKVLLPRLGVEVPDADANVVMEWSELMDGLTVLEARSREWPREWLEQGRQEGRQEGLRSLLTRQARRRFGPLIGERVTAVLADMRDPTRLEEVGELILDCDTGAELLRRINGKPG